MRKHLQNLLLISILIFLFKGCAGDENPVGPTDKIKTGGEVVLTTEIIGSAGGKIEVVKPGDPLDGLSITISENAFQESHQFKISYSDIKSHKFGQYFNPITPLIQIRTDAEYADSVIFVTIPIHKKSDEFAMAFFYNEKTKSLEGVPILKLDSNSITIMTRHFATSSISGNAKNGQIQELPGICNIIVSSFQQSVLDGQAVISTGFKPGVDDWEFYNLGSIIVPYGHCAGQSISAMYYFYEFKQKGAEKLNGQWDILNMPNDSAWEDNPMGYRLSSYVQWDYEHDSYDAFTNMLQENYDEIINNPFYDKITWYSFISAMLVTGEPQLVAIWDTKNGGGHAMIVYGIENGALQIADPNWPGALDRRIKYESNKFSVYYSGDNKASIDEGKGKAFNKIQYIAKTALVSWDQVGKRFNDVFTGKQKMLADGYYVYCLKHPYRDEKQIGFSLYTEDGVEFNDFEYLFTDYFKDTCQVFVWTMAEDPQMTIFKYDSERKVRKEKLATRQETATLNLDYGLNSFTIHLYNVKENTSSPYYWLDFAILNIIRDSIKISPYKQNVDVDEEIELKLNPVYQENIVYNFRVDWDMDGDGKVDISKNNDYEVKYRYDKAGIYNVKASIFIGEDEKKHKGDSLTEANAEVYVGQPFITDLLPDKGNTGEEVIIKGDFFGEDKTKGVVTFNGEIANQISKWSRKEIRVSVPSAATSGLVVVKVNNISSNGVFFKVLNNDKITIPITMDTTFSSELEVGLSGITNNFKDVIKIPYTMSYKVTGQFQGNIDYHSNYSFRETLSERWKRWTIKCKAPGKFSVDVNLSISSFVVSSQQYELNSKVDGKDCRLIIKFNQDNNRVFSLKYFNEKNDDDLLKYLPNAFLIEKPGNFHFSMDVPSMEEINKIVHEHNINPYKKRAFLPVYLISESPLECQVDIYDSETDEFIKTEILTLWGPYDFGVWTDYSIYFEEK